MRASEPSLVMRRLRAGDLPALTHHLLTLAPEDRRLRFCGIVSDELIRRHCDNIDWQRKILIGCFVDGRLCGVAELAPLADAPGTAEVALTVDHDLQGQGIGSELLRRVIVLARNRFMHTLHMVCLPENMKMRRVAQKNGAKLSIHGTEAAGRIKAPWPSYLTLAEESLSESLDLVRTAFDTVSHQPARHH